MLKHFNIDLFEDDYMKFNIGKLRQNSGTNSSVKHFGVSIKDNGFLKISREKYIDYSIYDDIICRSLPFGDDVKLRDYITLIFEVLYQKKFTEYLEGIIDCADDFKKELFIYSLRNSWGAEWFFQYNTSIFDNNREDILESAQTKLKELQTEKATAPILEEYQKTQIEKCLNTIELCSNIKQWNMNQRLYLDTKNKILNAESIKEKESVGELIIKNPSIKKIIGKRFLLSETGIDFVLGNYSKNKIEKRIQISLNNFDANMSLMKKEDAEHFNNYLEHFVVEVGMTEIQSLKDCKTIGIYLMVLDEFKRVYIGQAEEISKRIRQHWSHTSAKPLGRLIFIDKNSPISINSFGPLDTTRIYIKKVEKEQLDKYEEQFIDLFESKYLLNRIPGGNIFIQNS